MKFTKRKIITSVVILITLTAAFFWGGTAKHKDTGIAPAEIQVEIPKSPAADTQLSEAANINGSASDIGQSESPPPSPSASTEPVKTEKSVSPTTEPPNSGGTSPPPKISEPESTVENKAQNADGNDKYMTAPIPEGKPEPVEPQNSSISTTALTCTLYVRCDTILSNIQSLKAEKRELVPDDGVIFAAKTVTFYEGESVFNLLQREMKRAKIHMEFVNTPIYNSAYIEGIHNLYEFDCGELSGWMYRVNGWFPNYGCSRYRLKSGDIVEWVYSCDLGRDVGGDMTSGGNIR